MWSRAYNCEYFDEDRYLTFSVSLPNGDSKVYDQPVVAKDISLSLTI